ncbi:hypothetical protein SAMN05660337_0376 [Maridesulfovibrio ferrireducens]|uniref:Uncharacterized protein n=1 Tax=Maridesulfovibrio ferrireducens TaxID=246191 RepID=A0A1G9BQD1_9BACT|nr:hypothetical protein [Maridesulfovibrio ferrireducens]SDK41470.1 hypothetical protein SAMN05660337_0376 [Maridesulfovibrio ferrireducens]
MSLIKNYFQRLIHGLARVVRYNCSSFFVCFFILFLMFSNVTVARAVDASIFLGPPLGETIILDVDDGVDIKRTTTAVSESEVYSIEDRRRLLPGKVTKEDIIKNNLSEKIVRIVRGEEDLVNNITLQAKAGKIILSRHGKVVIILDLESRKGFLYLSTSDGDVKMKSHIVDEQEEFIRGKKRSSIYVESYGNLDDGPVNSNYRLVSGLGLTHMSLTVSGLTSVLYTLKEN